MGSLGGTSVNPMDTKGRVSFPSKYSRELHDNLVLVRSADREYPSLTIYREEDYDRWLDDYFASKGGFAENSKSATAQRQILYSRRESVSIDQAGRILIPANLRQYASLEKSVVFVGVKDHVKIWNPDILESYENCYDDFDLLDQP